ncbi:zinc-binding dehydrogenase [Corynebacterium accolens]|uniref:zinc-binding dehydrogenase n=1 Tax=Corynebacterium accolens TaxID=38284 RepID=UPI002490C97A|nr:zinc-binding dehydrogenase [Corynebacterium accolens]MDK4309240.1 zinc-binding dehydrogenase [Corynebacterium accolens]MDK4338171.1 zinc-binding dehydrogenase [Corynebacterium accolens]MDK8497817.1 zinc-binding dehydrogenase [Corynebacterium accolens]MDK8682423.1 zinc-binding dehydrogenase [Corynebacterium accolens]
MDVLDDLVQLMEQIAAGEIHLELEQVYPFADALAALAALAKVQTRRARGKLVLRRE